MTPQEFKAWFDGFTEALDGTPNKAQWTRIKARVAEIDGKPVTERVYVDRYWPTYISPQVVPYPPYRPWYGTTNAVGLGAIQGAMPMSAGSLHNSGAGIGECRNSQFDSLSAMNELGRNEALGVS